MLGALNRRRRRARGVTLVELVIAILIVGALAAIGAPMLQDYILLQRLKGINAQLVTDMQYARGEAAARNQFARVDFEVDSSAPLTCYAIFTADNNDDRCDCSEAPDSECTGSARVIRTVRIDAHQGVRLRISRRGQGWGFAYDHVAGGIWSTPSDDPSEPLTLFRVESLIDSTRILRNDINQAGRIAVCAPSSLTVGAPSC
jgi:type IV fimbrial biogenesis protein FimT